MVRGCGWNEHSCVQALPSAGLTCNVPSIEETSAGPLAKVTLLDGTLLGNDRGAIGRIDTYPPML